MVAVRGGLWWFNGGLRWFSGCLVVGWGVRSLWERGRRGAGAVG
jgi:hypothetical protein